MCLTGIHIFSVMGPFSKFKEQNITYILQKKQTYCKIEDPKIQ